MSFARPDLLWLAALLPLLAGAGVWGYVRRRRRVSRNFGDASLVGRLGLTDPERFATRRFVLVSLAALALGLAAAGPQWGEQVVESRQRARSVVLAVDVSKSMLARDVDPDRLERGRLFVRRLLRELPGDRLGLVAFAGRAYVLSPLTVDHSALQLYLDALDPEIVSQGGSSLASAIRQATDLARGETDREDRSRGPAIVLVSDGEALEEEAGVHAAAERAARAGVTVHTVGVGTAEGAPVPERDSASGSVTGYTHDPATGDIVVSRLGEELLRQVAETTGGRYSRLGAAGTTDRVLASLEQLERDRSDGTERTVQARPRFEWFVGLAVLLLALDAVWTRHRRQAKRSEEV